MTQLNRFESHTKKFLRAKKRIDMIALILVSLI